MSEWVNKCEDILTSIGLPYDFERFEANGDDQQLPDTYIVYFLVDDPGRTWTDGKETSHEPRIQVSLFYRNKADFLNYPDKIEKAFADAGFTLGLVGHIPYQPETGHYGWRRDFYYYERRDLNA